MVKKQRLQIAKEAALLAGKTLSNFKGKLKVQYKEAKDIVTKADIESEKEIVHLIKKWFPEDGIYSEEKIRYQVNTAKGVWFIDPLDGTVNFSRGLPLYGVSIGYVKNGTPKIGVIYLPEQNELYYAESGHGAFCNSKKINVSKVNSINKAIIHTGDCNVSSNFSVDKLNKLKCELFHRLHNKCMRLRTFGSAATELAYVASGKIDGFITIHSHFFDIAAGIVIVQEAGGIVTDFQGFEITKNSKSMIASNSILNAKYKKKFAHSINKYN